MKDKIFKKTHKNWNLLKDYYGIVGRVKDFCIIEDPMAFIE